MFRKKCPIIILKVTKNQGSFHSLEIKVLEKQQGGGSNCPPPPAGFLRLIDSHKFCSLQQKYPFPFSIHELVYTITLIGLFE